jgi:hypothetical protein
MAHADVSRVNWTTPEGPAAAAAAAVPSHQIDNTCRLMSSSCAATTTNPWRNDMPLTKARVLPTQSYISTACSVLPQIASEPQHNHCSQHQPLEILSPT